MINLLPYTEKKAVHRIRMLRKVRTVFFALTLLLGIAALLLLPVISMARSRHHIATEQIASLERGGVIASEVDITSIDMRARTVERKLVAAYTVSPVERIAFVRSSIPSGITIERYALSDVDGVLEVRGVARDRALLQSFIKGLESRNEVKSVESPVSNFVKATNAQFRLMITFK